mgnify:CR=1 FL=1
MTFYTAAITLILVMDPLGNIPSFLAVLKRFDAAAQRRIIIRETGIAFIFLVVFLFCGQFIMHGLHLSAPALSVSGGIILFIIAIRLIFPPENKVSQIEDDEEPFIVPLAVPLTAGPSTLATVILLSSREPHHTMQLLISVVIATVVFLAIVLSGSALIRVLGKRGLVAIERLMGMILTTVAVQMFLTGIVDFIKLYQ